MSRHEIELETLQLNLSKEQTDQQIALAYRLLQIACLGLPISEKDDTERQAMLALHALSTAYLALASTNPGITGIAASLAFDISHQLQAQDERRMAAAH